jgi:alginate O-acetyltransferase complex protein AlgI
MTMTSMLFLFLFLPAALAVYHLTGGSVKEYVLLAVSLVFYALCSPEYILLFVAAIAVTVTLGRLICRVKTKSAKRTLLILGIILNAGLLVYYKYSGFGLSIWGGLTSKEPLVKNTALPLGISFFTFKAISYLADVYKGTAALSRNPLHDALYLSFFPQVQSGPLSRYNDLRTRDIKLFSEGVFRFLVGFCKKVLIADVLSKVTAEIFTAPPESTSMLYAWLGAICFSLQLLFDFAGYSDMAIGVSEMFGYKCPENFHYPYMTESVAGFWRRWHISLGAWFRDYVYIPLGGSRTREKWRVYFNLLAVWLLTGIWHGAAWNFVVWGLGYFLVIAFERLTGLPGRIRHPWGKTLYRFFTLLFINFQWVLFNAKDLSHGLSYLKTMFIGPLNALADSRALFLLKDYWFFILAAIILCFPLVPRLDKKLRSRKVLHTAFEAVLALTLLAGFAWAVSLVVAGLNNPFAYANF